MERGCPSGASPRLISGRSGAVGRIIWGTITDRTGYAASEKIYGPENLVSSVYLKLGIEPGKILYGANGRPAHLVNDPRPIAELM